MNAPASLQQVRDQVAAPREPSLPAIVPGFGSLQGFELAIRQAKLLSSSTLVPAQYRALIEKKQGQNVSWQDNPNAIPNCVIAMNMAQRMNADPLMVMQNLYIVEGRPSWSSTWIIAAINNCGRFTPLRFDLDDLGEQDVEYDVGEWVDGRKQWKKVKTKVRNLRCVAWAEEKATGQRVTSPAVSMEMAVKEGWYQKTGSKWQTMPEVMLRYRTASFFGKLYAPELLMGLPSSDEAGDIIDAERDSTGQFSVDIASLRPTAPADEPAPEATAGQVTGATTSGDPQDDDLRAVEQGQGTNPGGNWQPSPEEAAEMERRVAEEAAADQRRANAPRGRGQRSMNLE